MTDRVPEVVSDSLPAFSMGSMPRHMKLTDYHAKYFAHELTKRCSSDSLEKLAGAVAGAQVDLNPHQIDAALFAFRSGRRHPPTLSC